MFGVLPSNVLDGKIINNKYKLDGTGFLLPQSRSVVALKVSMARKSLFEEFVGKNAGLR